MIKTNEEKIEEARALLKQLLDNLTITTGTMPIEEAISGCIQMIKNIQFTGTQTNMFNWISNSQFRIDININAGELGKTIYVGSFHQNKQSKKFFNTMTFELENF